jgi:hypothetical protein
MQALYNPSHRRILSSSFAVMIAITTFVQPAFASSHMDAPLITLDPAANTTDVYAFVTENDGQKNLVVALGVYSHQEPGIGPNKYNFDDDVLYEIHVALGDDVQAGEKTMSCAFTFDTEFQDEETILQSFRGVIDDVGDSGQNLIQTYTVVKEDHRDNSTDDVEILGTGVVPPNNQGIATPLYNQANNGENPATDGVSTFEELDRYTQQAITPLDHGYVAFAGQRDDGFFADIQSIFDLLSLRNPGEDSQGGFNLHLMALRIPIEQLGGDQQVVGVYATTSRQRVEILREPGDINGDDRLNLSDAITLLRVIFLGRGEIVPQAEEVWVQVGRQGNPLFNEGFVAIEDKDLYSSTSPTVDNELFRKYAEEPELAQLINDILLGGDRPDITVNRTDIAGIYIPDVIKVDLSTPPARLAGNGPEHATNPDEEGFSRLSVFTDPPDALQSQVQDPFGLGGLVPGGWPNGRRFGDDVVDIAINAVLSDLRVQPPVLATFPPGDGVSENDIGFKKVFPYEGTPQNGRNHEHP